MLVAVGAQATSAIKYVDGLPCRGHAIDLIHDSISQSCQSTLAQLVTSSETTCLNAGSLVGLVVSTQNTSVVSTVNSWLTGLCSQTACSNQTLADVVSNVTSGCQSDLQSAGIQASASELTSLVQQYYPTARKAACLAE